MKNKSILMLFSSILIILYTEIVCLNIDFAFNYLPIVIFIISLVLLNVNLKHLNTSKTVILVTNLIVVSFVVFPSILIFEIFDKYNEGEIIKIAAICSISILSYNLKKIDFSNLDKAYFVGILKFFILPLFLLIAFNQLYNYFIIFLNDFLDIDNSLGIINKFEVIMVLIFRIILVDITFILFTLSMKNLLNDIKYNKYELLSMIFIILIIFIIKICILVPSITLMNKNIKILTSIYPASSIDDYNIFFEKVIDEPTDAETGEYILDFSRAISSFNELYTCQATKYSSDYITNIQLNSNPKNNSATSKRQILEFCNSSTEIYIDVYKEILDNLIKQIFYFIIIYVIDLISIIIIFKFKESN